MLLVVACAALAVLSLPLPSALGFDPWAWIVWGREVIRLDLDTTGGPSWKPLPVVFTSVFSPFGELAPGMWLVVARTGGLLLLVGCYQLASRFAGPAAGLIAAGLVLLTPDGEPRFLRTLAEGHDAPMSAALAVWAIERHLAGRHRTSLVLMTGLALLRPESWPFVLVYSAWQWRRQPHQRAVVLWCLAAVPVLWFGGDWWGSGSPFHGADVARVSGSGAGERTSDALVTLVRIVPPPVWALAVAVTAARGRHRRSLLILASMPVVWSAIVVAMAVVLRYAAISRFFLPAAVVVCVLAGVGCVQVASRATAIGGRALATAVFAAAIALAVPRAVGLADVVDEVSWRADLQSGVPAAVARAGGLQAAEACGTVAAEAWTALRPAIAWEIDVPLRTVRRTPEDPPVLVFVATGSREHHRLADLPPSQSRLVTNTGTWAVYALGCLDR